MPPRKTPLVVADEPDAVATLAEAVELAPEEQRRAFIRSLQTAILDGYKPADIANMVAQSKKDPKQAEQLLKLAFGSLPKLSGDGDIDEVEALLLDTPTATGYDQRDL